MASPEARYVVNPGETDPANPVTVQMGWSRHSNGSAVDLQGLYDEAARHLAEDNHERVKHGDPRLNDPAQSLAGISP